MKRCLRWVALAGTMTLLSACGNKGPGSLTSADAKSFDQAPPETKQMWAVAMEAARTNDYVTAYNMLYTLGGQSLSPEQQQAVSRQTAALNDQIIEGVGKGDPLAQKAMQELKNNPMNRQH